MNAKSVRLFVPAGQGSPPLISSEPTVAQVLDWFELIEGNAGDAKASKERRRVRGLLRAKYGDRLCSACRPFDLLNFISEQPDVGSDWTRKRWNATCQRPFNRAEKLGLIVKNPFRGLTFPEGEDGRDWTAEEYRQILRASDAFFRRYVIGLRKSGLRPGEGRDLQWPDIKFEANSIRIDKHKTRHKTKKPRRIPLNRSLLKLLIWCKIHNPPGSKHVFLNSFGRPWTCKAADKRLDKIRVRLGLPRDLKLHGVRHTFATQAIMNGVGIAELMELLGHKMLTTTQRYTHLSEKVDHLAGAMEQAVNSRPKAKPPQKPAGKPAIEMPLFDGLE